MDDPTRHAEGLDAGEWIRRRLLLLFLSLLLLGLAWLLVETRDVLLLLFGAVLLAVFVHDLACRLSRLLPLPHKLAVGLIMLALLSLFAGTAWIAGGRIGREGEQLLESLPQALERLYIEASYYPWLVDMMGNLPEPRELFGKLSQFMPQAGLFFGGVFGVLANIGVLLFVATYLAAQPRPYRYGLMLLVPPRQRQRAGEVLEAMRHMLAQWLIGKAFSMLVVGVLTTVGLLLLGMPLALVLGVIAGLLDFIPYLGPIMAGVPAVLLALADSPTLALWVALLFFAIQMAEGYLLIPVIERRTVSLPPALTIAMQVILGSVFGLGGVALATPLVAVLAVLVTMLYVQDVLKVPADPPGQK